MIIIKQDFKEFYNELIISDKIKISEEIKFKNDLKIENYLNENEIYQLYKIIIGIKISLLIKDNKYDEAIKLISISEFESEDIFNANSYIHKKINIIILSFVDIIDLNREILFELIKKVYIKDLLREIKLLDNNISLLIKTISS